jgi:hypothetical protein
MHHAGVVRFSMSLALIRSSDGRIDGAINCGPAGVGKNPQRDAI